jgi:hypothetical protein
MTLSPRCVRRSPNVARRGPLCPNRDRESREVLSLDRTDDERMSEKQAAASFAAAGLVLKSDFFEHLFAKNGNVSYIFSIRWI